MNIYMYEMKRKQKALIFWTLGTLFFLIAGMTKGSAFQGDDAEALSEMMKVLPDAVIALYGMNGLDLANPEHYYAVMYTFLILLFALHAVVTTSSVILTDYFNKTTEYLYTKPMLKKEIILIKVFVIMSVLFFFNFLVYLADLVYLHFVFPEIGVFYVTKLAVNLFLIQIMFMGVTLLIITFVSNYKMSTKLASAIVFIMFFIGIGYDLLEHGLVFKYLSPFKFFQAIDVYNGEVMVYSYVVSLLFALIGMVSIIQFFSKRDIN